jgi:hypothetical protein
VMLFSGREREGTNLISERQSVLHRSKHQHKIGCIS